MSNSSRESAVRRTAAGSVHARATPRNWVTSEHIYIRARRHVPRNPCMAPLLYIINTSSSLKGWAELLVELQRLSRAAIGREPCQSASQRSPTSSVLLFCSSQRGEGNGCFLRESAPLPQPAPRHLSLTYSTKRKLSGSRPSSAASPPVFMSALPVSLPVCVCVEPLLLSTCGASAGKAGRGGETRPRPAKALMGGTAGPARSWGC